MLVATNIFLSRQNFYPNKTIIATSLLLSDKHVSVATKMTLVAAPANDNEKRSYHVTSFLFAKVISGFVMSDTFVVTYAISIASLLSGVRTPDISFVDI